MEFSYQARKDLPREVSSYVDGLAAQVREICERHGVNPADLGKMAIQEKLQTSELTAVRQLVARIIMLQRGEVDVGSRREIVNGLDEREAAAGAALSKALADLATDGRTVESVTRWYLRAGLVAEARAYISNFKPALSFTIEAEVEEAEGVALLSTDPERALKLLGLAARLECDSQPLENFKFTSYFQTYARSLPANRFFQVLARCLENKAWKPVTYHIVELEAERRGIDLSESFVTERVVALDVSGMLVETRVACLLAMARADATCGKDPKKFLDEALLAASEESDRSVRVMLLSEVADTAAMVSTVAFVDHVVDLASEIINPAEVLVGDFSPGSGVDVRSFDEDGHKLALFGAIDGFARAGKFDDAISMIWRHVDAYGSASREFAEVVQRVLVAMFDRDEVDRALTLTRSDFDGVATESRLRNGTEQEYVAALARRGEDALQALSTMHSQVATGPFARRPSSRAFGVANAAIATIGYVRNAKLRMVALPVPLK